MLESARIDVPDDPGAWAWSKADTGEAKGPES